MDKLRKFLLISALFSASWILVGCWHGYLSGARCRLNMAQLMLLPLTVSSPVKSRLVLPFWHRPTRVVLDTGSLNGCCFLPAGRRWVPVVREPVNRRCMVPRSSWSCGPRRFPRVALHASTRRAAAGRPAGDLGLPCQLQRRRVSFIDTDALHHARPSSGPVHDGVLACKSAALYSGPHTRARLIPPQTGSERRSVCAAIGPSPGRVVTSVTSARARAVRAICRRDVRLIIHAVGRRRVGRAISYVCDSVNAPEKKQIFFQKCVF